MKTHRGRLRPYTEPPYKHKKSHYELRMRDLREKLRIQALKIASRLTEISPDDPALPVMLKDLDGSEHVDQLLWIDAATDEMFELANGLEEDSITRLRTNKLTDIKNRLFTALDHIEKHGHGRSKIRIPDGDVPGPKSQSGDTPDSEKAITAKTCMVELIEGLALPFWPREKPAEIPSPYSQGLYKPRMNRVRQRMKEEEEAEAKQKAERKLAAEKRARAHIKVRLRREAEAKKAEEEKKNQPKEVQEKKPPKVLIVRRAGNFRKENLQKMRDRRKKNEPSSPRPRTPVPKNKRPNIEVRMRSPKAGQSSSTRDKQPRSGRGKTATTQDEAQSRAARISGEERLLAAVNIVDELVTVVERDHRVSPNPQTPVPETGTPAPDVQTAPETAPPAPEVQTVPETATTLVDNQAVPEAAPITTDDQTNVQTTDPQPEPTAPLEAPLPE